MTEAAFDTIQVAREGAVLRVTLARPERRNAIDRAMVGELHRVLDDLAADDGVHALVLAGAGGKAFAAGADIAELLARTRDDALAAINSGLFERIESARCPVIAAIQGFALGGGLELALACDIRIAGRSARLGQPEVALGIIPAAGATYRLPRLVGHGRARELIFTGRIVGADEALAIGLVEEVVDDGEVEARALALAGEIAKNAPLAVRLAKAMLNGAARGARLGEVESIAQGLCFDSADKRARMQAFLDRKGKR